MRGVWLRCLSLGTFLTVSTVSASDLWSIQRGSPFEPGASAVGPLLSMPLLLADIQKCGVRDFHWQRVLLDRFRLELVEEAGILARGHAAPELVVHYYLGAYNFAAWHIVTPVPPVDVCRRWRTAPRLVELDAAFEEERARLVAGLPRRPVPPTSWP